MEATQSEASTEPLPVILNGEFFEVVVRKGDSITARCKLGCPTSKTYNGALKSTANFLRHIKNAHPKSLDAYEKRKKDEAEKIKKSRMEFSMARQTTIADKQASLDTHFNVKNVITRTDRLIQNLVVKGTLPVSIVEVKEFQELVKGLSPTSTVLSRRTLCKNIQSDYEQMVSDIKLKIAAAKFLCTTADIWTCPGMSRSFLGCTVHLIADDLTRRSYALACRRFPGTHYFDKIAELLTEVFDQYGIPVRKITKMITDNGSNFVKAFEEYKLNEPDTEDEDDEIIFEYMEVHMSSSHDYELPPHHRCSSHTLSLIGSSDVKKFKSKVLTAALAKWFGIWNKVSRSSKAAESAFDICKKRLTKPCVTRWNSLYDSITDLLKLKIQLNTLSESLGVSKMKEQEIEILEEYCECLKPIAQALDTLQGEQTCYFGELVPTLLTIERKLNLLSSTQLKHCEPLLEILKSSLTKRFRSLMELSASNREAITASVSHPYFKLRWVPTEKVAEVREIFMIEVKSCINQPSDLKQMATGAKKSKMDDKFFGFNSTEGEIVQNIKEDELYSECHNYFIDGEIELHMLHRFPAIKHLFIKYNTAVPS